MATDDRRGAGSADEGPGARRRALQLAVLGLLLAGTVAALVRWWPEIWSMVRDPEHFKRVIQAYGAAAPLAFIAAQFVQVVVFFIPGEVTQIAGGYIFGAWAGLLYSYVGITLGSLVAFYVARLFERAVVEWLVARERIQDVHRILYGKSGFWPMLLLFLLPGIPKDLLCYVAGLTPMSVGAFLLLSSVGRLPGVVLSVVIGQRLEARDWWGVALSGGLAFLLAGLAYLVRKPLERVLAPKPAEPTR